MTDPTIEQRLAHLEEVRSIEHLKYRYAAYCDSGYDLDGLCSIFTPGGRWVANGFGDFTGHAEIRRFFSDLSHTVEHVVHYVTSPQIDLALDGRTAKGEFYLLCISTSRQHRDVPGGKRLITVGTYDDRFVKVDDRWLFAELRVNVACAVSLGAPQGRTH